MIIHTLLSLVKICTLPKATTTFVGHIMNGMNKALKVFILEKTMPFLDDAYIIICVEELKDEIVCTKGCQEILADHRVDYKKILTRLEKIHLIIWRLKSMCGMRKVLVVLYECRQFL
jgi:hypothetical protein